MAITVRAAQDDSDWEQFALVNAEAHTVPLSEETRWLEYVRPHLIGLVALEGERIIGAAGALRIAQWVGGRSVPAGGVTSVAVRPEARRRGVAGALMEALQHTLVDERIPLAPLWPGSTPLYRRLGWGPVERAVRNIVPISQLERLSGEGAPVRAPGVEALRAVQTALAPGWNGSLDRPAWWWDIPGDTSSPPEHHHLFGWEQDGELTGYVRFGSKAGAPWDVLKCSEFWAANAGTARGLLGLLGAHSSVVGEVAFMGTALPRQSVLAWLLPEPRLVTLTATMTWMSKLVDPAAAFAARGWPPFARGRLELEVRDPMHERPLRLDVQVGNGVAQAKHGGAGRMRIDSGTLAACFHGAVSASAAARMGLLEAERAHDLHLFDQLAYDRAAWLPEWF